MEVFTRPNIKKLLEQATNTPDATGIRLDTAETSEFFEQLSILLHERVVTYDGSQYKAKGVPIILSKLLVG